MRRTYHVMMGNPTFFENQHPLKQITRESLLDFYDPFTQTLSLDKNGLTDRDICVLFPILQELVKDEPIKKLSLYKNKIKTEGANVIARFLMVHPEVAELDISCNEIGDKGAKALAHTSLTHLHISNNNIGPLGAKALALNNTFKMLNISYNKLGDEGITFLARIYSLTELYVSECGFAERGIQVLAHHPALKKLDVSNNLIGDKSAQLLIRNTNLITLNMRNCKISEEGIKYIPLNRTLSSLNLVCNDLNYRAVAYLSRNQTLEDLNVGWNKSSDAGAKLLALTKTLKIVNLSCNQISEGAHYFGPNTSIRELILNGNSVSHTHLKSFVGNTALQTLSLADNFIEAEGAKYLATTNLKVLYLDANPIGAEGAKYLAKNTTIEVLSVENCHITMEGVLCFAHNVMLKYLNLSDNPITNNFLPEGNSSINPENSPIHSLFVFNKHLIKLVLNRCEIHDLDLKGAAQNCTLKMLYLSHNQINGEGAEFLAKNTSIEELDLSNNAISENNLQTLLKNTTLKTLDLMGNKYKIHNSIADWLPQNTTLGNIAISKPCIKDYDKTLSQTAQRRLDNRKADVKNEVVLSSDGSSYPDADIDENNNNISNSM